MYRGTVAPRVDAVVGWRRVIVMIRYRELINPGRQFSKGSLFGSSLHHRAFVFIRYLGTVYMPGWKFLIFLTSPALPLFFHCYPSVLKPSPSLSSEDFYPIIPTISSSILSSSFHTESKLGVVECGAKRKAENAARMRDVSWRSKVYFEVMSLYS